EAQRDHGSAAAQRHAPRQLVGHPRRAHAAIAREMDVEVLRAHRGLRAGRDAERPAHGWMRLDLVAVEHVAGADPDARWAHARIDALRVGVGLLVAIVARADIVLEL